MITIDSLLDLVKSETYQKQVISPVALSENDNEGWYHPTYKEHLGHFHWIDSQFRPGFYRERWKRCWHDGNPLVSIVEESNQIKIKSNQITGLLSLLLQLEDWIVGFLTSWDIYTNRLHLLTRLIFNTNKIWETFSPCGHEPARTSWSSWDTHW